MNGLSSTLHHDLFWVIQYCIVVWDSVIVIELYSRIVVWDSVIVIDLYGCIVV